MLDPRAHPRQETACAGRPDRATPELVYRNLTKSRDANVRERLILHHQGLVISIVSRFQGRGELLEDLLQVGNIGLIKALDRFDPSIGVRFSTYATPTILGEIRHHLRDKIPAIKIPRWLQQRSALVHAASDRLTQELGYVPTVAQVAVRLGIHDEEVLEALEAAEAPNLQSLSPTGDAQTGAYSAGILDRVGSLDAALEDFVRFVDLRRALAQLTARENEVISLRFFDEWSQRRIAGKLNISQMHVSRLEQCALTRLRGALQRNRCP